MFYRFIFFVSILFATTTLTAQLAPVKKVYAYRQSVHQGKKPAANEPLKSKEQFSIYAEMLKDQRPIINGIWINNNYYQCKQMPMQKTPVKKMGAAEESEFIAVPKTKNTVYELIIGKKQEPAPRPGSKLSNYLQHNELVLVYNFRGKQYFATAKSIQVLESIPLM